MATQREAYYCLVQHFKNQAEFNSTLQGKTCMIVHVYMIVQHVHVHDVYIVVYMHNVLNRVSYTYNVGCEAI